MADQERAGVGGVKVEAISPATPLALNSAWLSLLPDWLCLPAL